MVVSDEFDLNAWPNDLQHANVLTPNASIVMPDSIEMLSRCQSLLQDQVGDEEAGYYVFVVSAPHNESSLWIMRSHYLSAQLSDHFEGEWVFSYICA